MTKRSLQQWQSLLPITITAVFMLAALAAPSFAQNGIGKKYNSRDPRPCSEAASKTKAPTVAEAVASVICNTEHEAGIETLVLADEVKVTQIGKGTPYNRNVGGNFSDIDPDFLIYPIRGSFKLYHCTLSDGKTREKSCNLTEQPNATGRCYKNGFGQWLCSMSDGTVKDSIKVFPPGGTKGAVDAPDKDKPTETKDDNQTTGKTADKDENGFPKPDFSEMEKYFEIVRTDYDFTLGRFNMLVKATKKTNVFEWYLTFYDADGIKVKEASFNANIGALEPGAPTKIYGYTPTEKEMKQVTRIVVTRKPF